MSLAKNKIKFSLLLLALSGFLIFFLGGEYLHSRIHHHQNETSSESCPVHQLVVQAFTTLTVVITATSLVFTELFSQSFQFSRSLPHFTLASPRAPPASIFA